MQNKLLYLYSTEKRSNESLNLVRRKNSFANSIEAHQIIGFQELGRFSMFTVERNSELIVVVYNKEQRVAYFPSSTKFNYLFKGVERGTVFVLYGETGHQGSIRGDGSPLQLKLVKGWGNRHPEPKISFNVTYIDDNCQVIKFGEKGVLLISRISITLLNNLDMEGGSLNIHKSEEFKIENRSGSDINIEEAALSKDKRVLAVLYSLQDSPWKIYTKILHFEEDEQIVEVYDSLQTTHTTVI